VAGNGSEYVGTKKRVTILDGLVEAPGPFDDISLHE
jgi:hypothetical protein